MKSTFLLVLLMVWCASAFSFGGDAPDATKPADIENLKKIGAALEACQKAKGDYPDCLSDLVPDFLEAKALVSPFGVEADPKAAKGKNDPKLPCSYQYYFARDPGNRAFVKVELEEYGTTTPILQCTLYEKTLNLSFAGELYETAVQWEYDPETLRLIARNGWGPGASGRKLILTLVDDEGHRIPRATISVLLRVSSQHLPNRDFTANEDGEVTIPLGGGARQQCFWRTEKGDWYLRGPLWHFGDPGATIEGDVARMTVTMYPAGAMEGTVVDEHGMPLANAIVVVAEVRDGKATELTSTGTDGKGHWAFPLIPRRGLALQLTIAHSGQETVILRPSATSQPPLEAFFNHTATIAMPPPFPVKGRVLLDGQPVAGAQVDQVPFRDNTHIHATTNALGEFILPAEDRGDTAIFVTAGGLAPLREKVTLTADAPALEFRMSVGRPLKGRILLGPRQSLANAPILYLGMGSIAFHSILVEAPVIATTDAEGRFTWEHAPSMKDAYCGVILPDGTIHSFHWDTSQNDEFIHQIPPQ